MCMYVRMYVCNARCVYGCVYVCVCVRHIGTSSRIGPGAIVMNMHDAGVGMLVSVVVAVAVPARVPSGESNA